MARLFEGWDDNEERNFEIKESDGKKYAVWSEDLDVIILTEDELRILAQDMGYELKQINSAIIQKEYRDGVGTIIYREYVVGKNQNPPYLTVKYAREDGVTLVLTHSFGFWEDVDSELLELAFEDADSWLPFDGQGFCVNRARVKARFERKNEFIKKIREEVHTGKHLKWSDFIYRYTGSRQFVNRVLELYPTRESIIQQEVTKR